MSVILLLFLLTVPPPNSQVLKSSGSFVSDALHPFFLLLFEELFSRNYIKNPGCVHSSPAPVATSGHLAAHRCFLCGVSPPLSLFWVQFA